MRSTGPYYRGGRVKVWGRSERSSFLRRQRGILTAIRSLSAASDVLGLYKATVDCRIVESQESSKQALDYVAASPYLRELR